MLVGSQHDGPRSASLSPVAALGSPLPKTPQVLFALQAFRRTPRRFVLLPGDCRLACAAPWLPRKALRLSPLATRLSTKTAPGRGGQQRSSSATQMGPIFWVARGVPGGSACACPSRRTWLPPPCRRLRIPLLASTRTPCKLLPCSIRTLGRCLGSWRSNLCVTPHRSEGTCKMSS